MNEFLEQFLLEARELAEQATQELLALERSPDDREKLDGAFRAFHTLKGGAGIVDFMAMSRAVHAAEGALASVRAGDAQISATLIGDCLSCVDQVIQWLDEVEATGELPGRPDSVADVIVARFGDSAALMGRIEGEYLSERAASTDDNKLSPAARRVLSEQLLLAAESGLDGREGRLASIARVAINVLRHAAMQPEARRIESAHDADSMVNAIEHVLGGDELGNESVRAAPSRIDSARTLRIDAERVNALVNLMGELIVAKNAIAHIARLAEDGSNVLAPVLTAQHARLDRLVGSLQHAVLGLRVLPLGTVFQRFSRVVREMAVNLEKPASLVFEGGDTEADKAIVEMLFEPLLHVVRNAMDHGVETAPERAAAGKPVVATITLRAYRQSEHVVVEIADDGKGIDIPRVRKVALERGIASADVLSTMSGQDAIDLIFAPGFSTAREVTGMSGRGVGMDAVRTAVERIGGRVTIESEAGRGSIVRFVLPFSVMMTRVVTVEAAGQTFGIPLDAVLETMRIPRESILPIGSAGAFVLRNRTVAVVDLAQMLGQQRTTPVSPEAIVVIASIAGQWTALEVDRVGERMEVMLKPVEGLLSGMPGIEGTSLLGDGQVLLVLDLPELLS